MADTYRNLVLTVIAVFLLFLAAPTLNPFDQDAKPGSESLQNAVNTRLNEYLRFNAPTRDNVSVLANESQISDVRTDLDDLNTDFNQEDFAQETTLQGVSDDTNTLATVLGENGRSTDAYDIAIARETTSQLNLQSDHPYSPERWRVQVDGERQLVQYNNVPQYEHDNDVHRLTPNAGETVALESAESIPYIVHYEQWGSWALERNTSLQQGDFIRYGLFNSEDGYFLEQNASHDELEAAAVVLRNGNQVQRRDIPLVKPLTDYTRFELRENWYNAGEDKWFQTTTNLSRSDIQENTFIGATAPEGNRSNGPRTPTLPTRFEIHRGSGNDPIALLAGSTAILTAGGESFINRVKTDIFRTTFNNTENWQPVAAIRLDPDHEFIRGELLNVDLAEVEADTDAQVTVQQHAPSLVLQSNGSTLTSDVWSRPATHSNNNSIMEFTTQIEKAPDENGTPQWQTTDVGGFQTGWASLYTTGNKGAAEADNTQARRRPLYGSDVTVFWVKADDDGNPTLPSNVTIEYTVELDY